MLWIALLFIAYALALSCFDALSLRKHMSREVKEKLFVQGDRFECPNTKSSQVIYIASHEQVVVHWVGLKMESSRGYRRKEPRPSLRFARNFQSSLLREIMRFFFAVALLAGIKRALQTSPGCHETVCHSWSAWRVVASGSRGLPPTRLGLVGVVS